MDIEITPFDPVQASAGDLADHYAITNAVNAVDFPDRPAYTFDFYAAFLRTQMTVWGPRLLWVARHGGRIVGTASVDLPEPESPDSAIVQVRVPPELARRGIGTALLLETLATCRAEGRVQVVASNVKAGGSGEAWTRSLGFTGVAEWARQTLYVPNADRALWQGRAADGFHVIRWTGATPEELVAGVAGARTAMEDAPLGESSLEWPEWTVERIRLHEAEARRRGCELNTAVAVEDETGAVVALTEIEIQDGLLDTVIQQDTAVLSEYRGHGLGLMVKAAMMRWLTSERPEVTRIITNTAADNVHMIRVNRQLGYTTDHILLDLEATVDVLREAGRQSPRPAGTAP
jgi:GNAT superfamily N-acetyltransferase